MADDKDRDRQRGPSAPSPERQPAPAPPAEEQPAEQERALNETVPGGRFIVGDQTVDAEGHPLTE